MDYELRSDLVPRTLAICMALFFLLAFILFNRIGVEAFYAIKQELIGVLRAVHHLGTTE